jgi:hypothetical protein
VNVIISNIPERAAGGKPHHTFPHPAPDRSAPNQQRGPKDP